MKRKAAQVTQAVSAVCPTKGTQQEDNENRNETVIDIEDEDRRHNEIKLMEEKQIDVSDTDVSHGNTPNTSR